MIVVAVLVDSVLGQWRVLLKLCWMCGVLAQWCASCRESCDRASWWWRDSHLSTY